MVYGTSTRVVDPYRRLPHVPRLARADTRPRARERERKRVWLYSGRDFFFHVAFSGRYLNDRTGPDCVPPTDFEPASVFSIGTAVSRRVLARREENAKKNVANALSWFAAFFFTIISICSLIVSSRIFSYVTVLTEIIMRRLDAFANIALLIAETDRKFYELVVGDLNNVLSYT